MAISHDSEHCVVMVAKARVFRRRLWGGGSTLSMDNASSDILLTFLNDITLGFEETVTES
jgi:hypothetical protein